MSPSQDTSTKEQPPQHLTLPFVSRSWPGRISVAIQPNSETHHRFGMDIIFPHEDLAQFANFPICTAEVKCPLSNSNHGNEIEYGTKENSDNVGYASLFGWIQLVRATPKLKSTPVSHEAAKLENKITAESKFDAGEIKTREGTGREMESEKADIDTGEWEIDLFPSFAKVNSPFTYWGFCPTLFDAPARLNPKPLKWRAQAFLCVLDDAGLGRSVRVLENAGFGWGFDVVDDGGDDVPSVVISTLERLDVAKEWGARLGYLKERFPGWTFCS